MITLRFYRASTYKPNRQMRGSFYKQFSSIEAAVKYLSSIRQSDLWLDPTYLKQLTKDQRYNFLRKFQVMCWGKCYV